MKKIVLAVVAVFSMTVLSVPAGAQFLGVAPDAHPQPPVQPTSSPTDATNSGVHGHFSLPPSSTELPVMTSGGTYGAVTVTADPISQQAITLGERGADNVVGYRILIYSNSSQSARGQANSSAARARAIMPGIHTVVEYDNPFFRTYAGSCLHRIEAVRLLGLLKPNFPNAVISTKRYKVSYFSQPDSQFTFEVVVPDESESTE